MIETDRTTPDSQWAHGAETRGTDADRQAATPTRVTDQRPPSPVASDRLDDASPSRSGSPAPRIRLTRRQARLIRSADGAGTVNAGGLRDLAAVAALQRRGLLNGYRVTAGAAAALRHRDARRRIRRAPR